MVPSNEASSSTVQALDGYAMRYSMKSLYGTLSLTVMASVFGSYPFGR